MTSHNRFSSTSTADDEVVSIACGEAHSLAVTKNGKVYAWGYGDLLQLGAGISES